MSHLDTIVYHRAGIRVGTFRCPAGHPSFEDSGPTDGHLFVFPRTSVRITHAGGDPVVADRNTVMFYNRRQVYRRGQISPRGDFCDWFSVDAEAVVDAVAPYDAFVRDHPHRPFAFSHGPSRSSLYLRQRQLVEHLHRRGAPEELWMEESVLDILRQTVAEAYRARQMERKRRRAATRRAHAELARAARERLAQSFREPLGLERLARDVHSSPYHLSRIFREQVGLTVHAYLTQLRLRAALEAASEPECDLSALAFDLGFSSHSHLSSAFRRAFGIPPSRLRTRLSSARLVALRGQLAV